MAQSKEPKKDHSSKDGGGSAPKRKSTRVNPLARNPLLRHAPAPEELRGSSGPTPSIPSVGSSAEEEKKPPLPSESDRENTQEDGKISPPTPRPETDSTPTDRPVPEAKSDAASSTQQEQTVAALRQEIEKLKERLESAPQNAESTQPRSEEPWRKMFGSGRVTSVTMARETLDTLKYLQHQFEAGAGHGFTAKQRDIINFSVLFLGHLLKEIGPFEFARRFEGIASGQTDEFYASLWQECQTRISPK